MKNRKVFTLLLTGMLTLSMGSTVYASGTDAADRRSSGRGRGLLKKQPDEGGGTEEQQKRTGREEGGGGELESAFKNFNEDLTNSISELSIQAAEKEDELNKVKNRT